MPYSSWEASTPSLFSVPTYTGWLLRPWARHCSVLLSPGKSLGEVEDATYFTSGDAIITVLHGQRYLLLQTDVWGGTRGDLWAQVWGRRLHRCPGVKHYANAARAVSRASSRVAGRLGAVSGRCISEIIRKTVGPGWEQSRGSQRRIKFQMEERGWKSLMIWGLEIASTLDFFFSKH